MRRRVPGKVLTSPPARTDDARPRYRFRSSYVISSSGLIDPSSNCRSMMSDAILQSCGDLETRDSSPQSTSFDGYDHPRLMTHQQLLMKKNHSNKPHRVSDCQR